MSKEINYPKFLKKLNDLGLNGIEDGSEEFKALESVVADKKIEIRERRRMINSCADAIDFNQEISSLIYSQPVGKNFEIVDLEERLEDKSETFRRTYKEVASFIDRGFFPERRVDFLEKYYGLNEEMQVRETGKKE